MTQPVLNGIAPFFIVRNAAAAVAFYRDKLGFDVIYRNDEWSTDPFFAIVCRGAAMLMVKAVDVDPAPNPTRDPAARWDAYVNVPDPDALAAEFTSRDVSFSKPLKDTHDGLRGFELKDADGYVLFFGRPRAAKIHATFAAMKKTVPVQSASASIDKRIEALGDWRGKVLAKVREIVHQADPEIVEEWKWARASSPGTPVWSHAGIVCTGETYKNAVKLTFARGAALNDPSGLFNSSLDGNVRRAIDIHEGEKVNEAALKDLIRAAVALNLQGKSKPRCAPNSGSRKRAN